MTSHDHDPGVTAPPAGGTAPPAGVTAPPAPEPDDKDWTWVLQAPCPECGYQSGLPHDEIAGAVEHHVQRWAAVLRRDDVRDRPEPTTWSPLEYGCHVRDVYRVFAERLGLMLTQDDPAFANWDQDATALENRYWTADPARVTEELAVSGAVLAAAFAAVPADAWSRTGRRSNGSVFTVETLAWYFLHDDVHHLADVHG